MKTPILATIFSLIFAISALAGDVTISEAKKLIAEGKIAIVDIRTPEEFAAGHIEGAKSINFFDENFEKELAKLDPEKPVIFHCKSGGRSTKALAIFKKLDFKTIYHMKDGYDAWSAAK